MEDEIVFEEVAGTPEDPTIMVTTGREPENDIPDVPFEED